MQSGIGGNYGLRGPSRSRGRSPGTSGTSSVGNGSSAKKDEEDFDPVVLNDVAGWLRTLRLHKYRGYVVEGYGGYGRAGTRGAGRCSAGCA
jgi:hypothetical protein